MGNAKVIELLRESDGYVAISSKYKRPGCATNDYLQREAEGLIARGELAACYGVSNAFLFVRKPVGQRLYYYLNDDSERLPLPPEDCMTEILFRGNDLPVREINYLKGCGFVENLIRDNYAVATKDVAVEMVVPNPVIIRPTETVAEVKAASELFNASFDALSGDHIDEAQYDALLDSCSILIARDENGGFCGALHQTLEGATAWVSHIAVIASVRGKGIGNALMASFFRYNIQRGVRRFACWVQRQNAPAVAMYEKYGFRFIGKSTLSLIKTK